ncbi:MAG: tetratricopeptide repeat protein, partial [Planctomycetota bacterium]
EDADFGARADELAGIIDTTPADERKQDLTVMWSVDDRLQANIGRGWATFFAALNSPEQDYELALSIFENTSLVWPESHQIHTGVGTVLMAMGHLQEGEAALREAVRLNPAYSEAWHNLGECLAMQSQWDDARACFEQALVHRPGHLDDLLGAAKAASDGRRYDIAERHLAEAERLHPASSEPVFWRGVLEAARGDLNSALGRFDRVLSINPDHPQALLQQGKVLIQLGRPESAVRALARACELVPDSFDAYYHMAALLLSTPEGATSALPYLQQAYVLGPPDQTRRVLHEQLAPMVEDDLRTLMALATLADRRNDARHALDWIERSLVLAAANPQSLPSLFALLQYRRGTHLEALDKPLEAVDAYRECLRLESDHFFANHDLALLLHHHLGRSEEARGHAQAALDRLPLVIDKIDPAFRQAMRDKLTTLAEWEPSMGPSPVIPEGEDRDGK